MNGPPPQKRGPAPAGDLVDLPAPKTSAGAEAWSKKRRSYKPLPTRFRDGGFDYRQIAREGSAAIYEQTWSGCSNPAVSYEIIRIRRREGFEIGGRFVEPSEIYPNSEAWGVDGFTLTDKDEAFAKLRSSQLLVRWPRDSRPVVVTSKHQSAAAVEIQNPSL
jgi:hypothetical protein